VVVALDDMEELEGKATNAAGRKAFLRRERIVLAALLNAGVRGVCPMPILSLPR